MGIVGSQVVDDCYLLRKYGNHTFHSAGMFGPETFPRANLGLPANRLPLWLLAVLNFRDRGLSLLKMMLVFVSGC